jgi:GT2 family glycosyltransferase
MNVSVIFVNFNIIAFLKDAIESVLLKTHLISYEIIVVDNNSQDNSELIIQGMDNPNITYLKLPENVGFGRANHEGIKIAKGDVFFLLNPDTLLLNNAIKVLVDYLVHDREVGVVGGNLYDQDEQPTYSHHRKIPSIWTEEVNRLLFGLFRRVDKNMYHNFKGIPLLVDNVSGANMMF